MGTCSRPGLSLNMQTLGESGVVVLSNAWIASQTGCFLIPAALGRRHDLGWARPFLQPRQLPKADCEGPLCGSSLAAGVSPSLPQGHLGSNHSTQHSLFMDYIL